MFNYMLWYEQTHPENKTIQWVIHLLSDFDSESSNTH